MTTLLLYVNIHLVRIALEVNRDVLFGLYPDQSVQVRFAQAMQIFFPVVLTLIEFWIFDRIIDRAFGYGRKSEESA